MTEQPPANLDPSRRSRSSVPDVKLTWLSPRRDEVSFDGDRGAFFRLVARGAALEFVTLGLYRFWLVTDVRRHLWSNTVVGGEAAEYIGTGREILIGFLFALAILAPVYIAYFWVGIELAHAFAFGSVPLIVFLYGFGQFAVFRARRYRLTRTVWRGVRFWMTGSGTAYALRSVLWAALVIVTLGLAMPWRVAALERYKMRNSYYGDLQGNFVGRGGGLFKQAWYFWAYAVVFLALCALLGKAPVHILVLIMVVGAPSVYAAYKAVEWRWWVSGVRFGDVHFSCDLRWGSFGGLYWKVIAWMALLSAVLGALDGIAAVFVGLFTGMPVKDLFASGHGGSVPMFVVTALIYLAYLLAFNVVLRVYLQRDLLQRVCDTVKVYDIAAADDVTGIGVAASAIGEGLADGLDVAGF